MGACLSSREDDVRHPACSTAAAFHDEAHVLLQDDHSKTVAALENIYTSANWEAITVHGRPQSALPRYYLHTLVAADWAARAVLARLLQHPEPVREAFDRRFKAEQVIRCAHCAVSYQRVAAEASRILNLILRLLQQLIARDEFQIFVTSTMAQVVGRPQ